MQNEVYTDILIIRRPSISELKCLKDSISEFNFDYHFKYLKIYEIGDDI
jgi:hypothetical protein